LALGGLLELNEFLEGGKKKKKKTANARLPQKKQRGRAVKYQKKRKEKNRTHCCYEAKKRAGTQRGKRGGKKRNETGDSIDIAIQGGKKMVEI